MTPTCIPERSKTIVLEIVHETVLQFELNR